MTPIWDSRLISVHHWSSVSSTVKTELHSVEDIFWSGFADNTCINRLPCPAGGRPSEEEGQHWSDWKASKHADEYLLEEPIQRPNAIHWHQHSSTSQDPDMSPESTTFSTRGWTIPAICSYSFINVANKACDNLQRRRQIRKKTSIIWKIRPLTQKRTFLQLTYSLTEAHSSGGLRFVSQSQKASRLASWLFVWERCLSPSPRHVLSCYEFQSSILSYSSEKRR